MNRLVLVALTAPIVASTLGAQVRQSHRTRNVFLVVTDGLRWQEVFSGADSSILFGRPRAVRDTAATRRDFWRSTPDERRRALLPFLWSTIAARGAIYGNKDRGSTVRVTNGVNVSYPGYNEMLTGRADPRIRDNGFGRNPNTTVFDWLSEQPSFEGRIAVFGTWSTFDDIFNRDRARFPVHASWSPPYASPRTYTDSTLNERYRASHREWRDVASDALMHSVVVREIERSKPRVLFIGYGETDEWAHAGRYDNVLRAAHAVDAFVAELWSIVQSTPEYRDSTTIIITTDHGRGSHGQEWRDHGANIAGAGDVWLAMIGPDTPPFGERTDAPRLTQSQTAATILALLGEPYSRDIAPPIVVR